MYSYINSGQVLKQIGKERKILSWEKFCFNVRRVLKNNVNIGYFMFL